MTRVFTLNSWSSGGKSRTFPGKAHDAICASRNGTVTVIILKPGSDRLPMARKMSAPDRSNGTFCFWKHNLAALVRQVMRWASAIRTVAGRRNSSPAVASPRSCAAAPEGDLERQPAPRAASATKQAEASTRSLSRKRGLLSWRPIPCLRRQSGGDLYIHHHDLRASRLASAHRAFLCSDCPPIASASVTEAFPGMLPALGQPMG